MRKPAWLESSFALSDSDSDQPPEGEEAIAAPAFPLAEGLADELDGAVVQQEGGGEQPVLPVAPDLDELLCSAVGQPALSTICRLNDQIARRFAKLGTTHSRRWARSL